MPLGIADQLSVICCQLLRVLSHISQRSVVATHITLTLPVLELINAEFLKPFLLYRSPGYRPATSYGQVRLHASITSKYDFQFISDAELVISARNRSSLVS